MSHSTIRLLLRILILVSLAGLLPAHRVFADANFLFELFRSFGHFLLPFLLLSILFRRLFQLTGKEKVILPLCAAISFVCYLSDILPLYFYSQAEAGLTSTARQLKVVSSNQYVGNPYPQDFVQLLEREEPDIVGVTEATSYFTSGAGLRDRYKYFTEYLQDNGCSGVALYHNYEVVRSERLEWNYHWQGIFEIVSVDPQDPTALCLYLLHAPPPQLDKTLSDRAKYFDQFLIHHRTNCSDKKTIVIGDLNLTPFSSTYRRLLSEFGFINAATGYGFIPTWYLAPFQVIATTIDYLFHSAGIKIEDFRVEPQRGSDHSALIVTAKF